MPVFGPDLGFFSYLHASIPGVLWPAFRLSLACRRNLVTERRWNAVQQLTGLPANVLVALADFPGTPLCGACVPAVLPGLAVAGPAESAAGRPARSSRACLLLKGCAVQAVCGVDESEALHKGPCLEQSRLRVLDGPESRREVGDDLADHGSLQQGRPIGLRRAGGRGGHEEHPGRRGPEAVQLQHHGGHERLHRLGQQRHAGHGGGQLRPQDGGGPALPRHSGEDHAAGGRHQGGQRSPGGRHRRGAGLRAREPRRLHLGAAGLQGRRQRSDCLRPAVGRGHFLGGL